MRKPDFCMCENKGTDQLCGDPAADQCLCFHYIDSAILLLPFYEISSLLVFLHLNLGRRFARSGGCP